MALKFKQVSQGKYYEVTEKDFSFLDITSKKKITVIDNSGSSTSVIPGNGGTVRRILLQPKGAQQSNLLGKNSYSFTLSSDRKPFVVNMIRMTE